MGKVSTGHCLESNQRWLPIYQENQEGPRETNRMWVYPGTGRKLSETCSVAKSIWRDGGENKNTGHDAQPKIDLNIKRLECTLNL